MAGSRGICQKERSKLVLHDGECEGEMAVESGSRGGAVVELITGRTGGDRAHVQERGGDVKIRRGRWMQAGSALCARAGAEQILDGGTEHGDGTKDARGEGRCGRGGLREVYAEVWWER